VRARVSRWSVTAGALCAGLGLLGLAGPSAMAASAGQVSVHPAPDRSNVGATHSPRLLKQLAAPAAAGRTRQQTAAAIAGAVVPGAAQGVDVASYQHSKGAPIDWAQVATDGIQFAAVKATEGAYYRNPYALTDLAGAQAAGLTTVAYAFAIPNGNGSSSSPSVQADYLLSYLGASHSSVPILLDIEYNPYGSECYGLSRSAMVAWIAGFDSEIQARTGQLPIIYTTRDWWQTCTGGSTAFGQTPVWPAYYSSTATSPLVPAGWANWDFWQYSSAGTVPGIGDAGHTDLDQLNPNLLALLDPGSRKAAEGSPELFGLSQADPVNGPAPTFSATGLPPGISISTDGRISGWLGTPGTYHPAVTATAGTVSGSVSFTWTVTATSTGATGPVRLALGKCLNDVGNSSANGTRADIYTCNGSTAQRWTYAQDGTLRIHGKCLVPPSSPTGGARVRLEPCAGTTIQRWWLTNPRSISSALGPAAIGLLNPAAGMCLSDPGGSTVNGTRVVIGSCDGSKGQAWTPAAGPMSSQIPGLCLDDSANAAADGTEIDIYSCNGTSAQRWATEPNGTVQIHGKCLDVHGGGTTSGTPVDLWTCNGTGAQQWQLIPDADGRDLVNPQSGLCLTDPGDATARGTGLVIATCAGAAGQRWRDL
jgi:GH25 family lysozyme M1 (1,4-beta-N-acetylmuramidase)